MTTKNLSTNVYIAVFALGVFCFGTLAVYAQESTPAPAEGVLVSDTATTSEVTEPAAGELWYKLEQLTGEVNQGDFVVGPGRAELVINPGQTVVYEMSVSNRISDGRTFNLEIEDIDGSDDASRSVVFLGDQRGPYTLKDYISFPESSFNLDLGDRARIPVTISIPADAEPGGYYGGVLVSTIKQEGSDDENSSARSPIIARIGTLFFITVPGEVTKSGALTDVHVVGDSLWYESGPVTFNVSYENTGSVHLNPYGEIRIANLFGEEVGFVELEPWFVLPKSLRSRDISWNREMLFGRYTATVSINRGYDDIVDTATVTFYVLPWKIVLGTFVVIFLVLFTFRFLFRNFEFRRRS